ncbi:hypothetical protein AGLY_003658 [Aphis glycines]|uniref:Uncharacterized protein n=1 Tax=Aphis glycines TaxID=307491 RepID=A0A6G0U074_APHGL|nr:hypothetical protein AGLY_003658 [Aphis glycines]
MRYCMTLVIRYFHTVDKTLYNRGDFFLTYLTYETLKIEYKLPIQYALNLDNIMTPYDFLNATVISDILVNILQLHNRWSSFYLPNNIKILVCIINIFFYIYLLLLDRTQQHGESLDSILNSFEQYDATVRRVDRPVVVALVNKLRTVTACRSRTRESTVNGSLVTPEASNVTPCHAEPSALNPPAEPKRSPKKLCRANSILLRSPAMCGVVADRKKMFERR